jgi:hypothetical protein
MYILILIIIWICIGAWIGINYGDLWTMWITVPICIIFGPLSWIYYKIKEIKEAS